MQTTIMHTHTRQHECNGEKKQTESFFFFNLHTTVFYRLSKLRVLLDKKRTIYLFHLLIEENIVLLSVVFSGFVRTY